MGWDEKLSMTTLMASGLVNMPRTLITLLFISVTLSGCATFYKDGGFGAVQKTTKDLIGKDVQWVKSVEDQDSVQSRTEALLKKPLTVNDAVQIALFNNKGLQAAFYDLGISEADLVQAGKLPNPRFTMLHTKNNGDYEIEQSFTFNIFSLLTMPKALQIEKRLFEQTQRQTAMEVLRLANETRKAYFKAVAADQSTHYMQQVRTAAEASAELARNMVKAGNWRKLDQAREQGFYADAALGVARAERNKITAYEELTRLMGLWGKQTQFTLPER